MLNASEAGGLQQPPQRPLSPRAVPLGCDRQIRSPLPWPLCVASSARLRGRRTSHKHAHGAVRALGRRQDCVLQRGPAGLDLQACLAAAVDQLAVHLPRTGRRTGRSAEGERQSLLSCVLLMCFSCWPCAGGCSSTCCTPSLNSSSQPWHPPGSSRRRGRQRRRRASGPAPLARPADPWWRAST